jgi:O-antigen ligase
MLLLGGVFFALAWLMPGHYVPWVSFQQELAAAVGAGCVAASGGWRPRGVRWPTLAVVLMAVAGVPLIQGMTGEIRFHSDAVLAAMYLAGAALCVVAGSTLVHERHDELLDLLSGAFVAGAVVSTALAMCQWLRVPGLGIFLVDLPVGERAYANLAQPNHLATLLALGACGLLRWYEVQRIGGAVAGLGVAFLGVGMLATQSRTGWLFVAMLVVVVSALARPARLRIRPAAVWLGAGLFALGVTAWQPLNEVLALAGTSFGQRLQPGTRGIIWRTLLDAAGQSPWIGYGWTQVGMAQQATALSWPASHEYARNSHNLALDLVLWNGVPLGLLLLGLLAAWFARHWRACTDGGSVMLLTSVSAVFMHALLEYPLDYAYFLLPVCLLMGALDGRAGRELTRSAPRATLAVPALLLAAMVSWVAVEYIDVERTARSARFAVLHVGTVQPDAAPPDVVLLDAPREFHRYALTEARPHMPADELAWMRSVAQRNAYPPVMLRYALAAGLNGSPAESASELALLCRLHEETRCREARDAWAALVRLHPVLAAVAWPQTEP